MSVACQWARRDLALLSLLEGGPTLSAEWEKSLGAVSVLLPDTATGLWGGQDAGMQWSAV